VDGTLGCAVGEVLDELGQAQELEIFGDRVADLW
jgi:hypothetical protein